MKTTFNILVALLITNLISARPLPPYDFNSNEIRRSHEVRQALGTNRFSVNRMNQFGNTAFFAAISHECVALVQAKYDRFKPRPPHPRPPYPWPPHRPFLLGEIEGGPEPAPTPVPYGEAAQSKSELRPAPVGAINPDLYHDGYPYQKTRIFVTQVACHNNPRVRPMPISPPVYDEGIRKFKGNDGSHSSDLD